MTIPPSSPWAFGPLFELERRRLVDLLGSLDAADWRRPTPCPGWSVLGLATHLVGDDVTLLAGHRDGYLGTPAPAGMTEAEFIGWLDELQVEWVRAARRLSPRLVTDLLVWLGDQAVELLGTEDASAVTAHVSWASGDPVPVWLDQARELSERWIHRQQLIQALGRPSDLRPDLAEPVLDGLRWAYPFRLAAHRRPAGAAVVIDVTGPEVVARWSLVADGRSWRFGPAPSGDVVARLQPTTEQAWRLLTNNYDEPTHGPLVTTGAPEVVATLLQTRAIIGTPK